MSETFLDVDECARAIESALEAMDPPIEVFSGILTLIELAQPYGKRMRNHDAEAHGSACPLIPRQFASTRRTLVHTGATISASRTTA